MKKIEFILVFLLMFFCMELGFEIGRYGYLDSQTVGYYKPFLRSITLSVNDMGVEDAEYNFWHEFGHEIWYRRISVEEREYYKGIANANKRCWFGYDNSTTEDFADSYAHYKMGYSRMEFFCDEKRRFFTGLDDV